VLTSSNGSLSNKHMNHLYGENMTNFESIFRSFTIW